MNARLPQWQIIRLAQDEEPGLRGGEARGRGGLGTITAQPPGWGTDELSKFLVGCHQNQYGVFLQKRFAMAMLIAIDAEFAKVSKNWLNPPSEIAAMLFLRCHAAFRASAGLTMAGSVQNLSHI